MSAHPESGTGTRTGTGAGAGAGAGAGGSGGKSRADSKNMLPPRERRRNPFERVLMRLIATCGVVGIGVAIAAIMTANHSRGWIIGLVVSTVSVVLAAVLWSSRQL